MTEEAQSQLAEIEGITNAEPEPEPDPRAAEVERKRRAEQGYATHTIPPWGRGRKRKPEPVPADDDDDGDAIEDDDTTIVRPPVAVNPAALGLAVPGLPGVNTEPEVIAAQVNADKLSAQRAAVAAEIAATEAALGLKPGASARDVERLAVKLLAEGKSDDGATKLESLRSRLRRLTAAEEIAAKAVRDARELAARRLSGVAAQVEFVPACRAKALALLELIRCDWCEREAADRLRAGGFSQPQGTFHGGGLLDHWHNTIVCNLVHGGHLLREEVIAVMPFLNGI